jgi:hypothetical protein
LLPLNSTRKCKFYIAGGREKVSGNILHLTAYLMRETYRRSHILLSPRGKIANSDREIRQDRKIAAIPRV